MSSKLEILKKLSNSRSLLDQYSVTKLYLFGSYAREEQTSTSDIDLAVEFSKTPTLFEFVRLERDLEGVLGNKVDLVMLDSIKPRIQEYIKQDLELVA